MTKKRTILFYLSFGHGQDGDPGAVSGRFVERDIARKIMDACYKYLLAHKGRTYKVAYAERDGKGRHLWQHTADMARYRLKGYRVVAVDGHLNAGGGDGAEVWIGSSGTKSRLGRVLGGYILNELKKAGQNSRGIKTDGSFTWIKNGVGVPVIVEFGFVDNRTDRKAFDTDKEIRALGEAAAKGMIRYAERYQ